jgi:hypothetical protein
MREGFGNCVARAFFVAPPVLQFARDVRRNLWRKQREVQTLFGRNQYCQAARPDPLARAPDIVEALDRNCSSLLELSVTGTSTELFECRGTVTEIAFGTGGAVLREYAKRN